MSKDWTSLPAFYTHFLQSPLDSSQLTPVSPRLKRQAIASLQDLISLQAPDYYHHHSHDSPKFSLPPSLTPSLRVTDASDYEFFESRKSGKRYKVNLPLTPSGTVNRPPQRIGNFNTLPYLSEVERNWKYSQSCPIYSLIPDGQLSRLKIHVLLPPNDLISLKYSARLGKKASWCSSCASSNESGNYFTPLVSSRHISIYYSPQSLDIGCPGMPLDELVSSIPPGTVFNLTNSDVSTLECTVDHTEDCDSSTQVNFEPLCVFDQDRPMLPKLTRFPSLNISETLVSQSGCSRTSSLAASSDASYSLLEGTESNGWSTREWIGKHRHRYTISYGSAAETLCEQRQSCRDSSSHRAKLEDVGSLASGRSLADTSIQRYHGRMSSFNSDFFDTQMQHKAPMTGNSRISSSPGYYESIWTHVCQSEPTKSIVSPNSTVYEPELISCISAKELDHNVDHVVTSIGNLAWNTERLTYNNSTYGACTPSLIGITPKQRLSWSEPQCEEQCGFRDHLAQGGYNNLDLKPCEMKVGDKCLDDRIDRDTLGVLCDRTKCIDASHADMTNDKMSNVKLVYRASLNSDVATSEGDIKNHHEQVLKEDVNPEDVTDEYDTNSSEGCEIINTLPPEKVFIRLDAMNESSCQMIEQAKRIMETWSSDDEIVVEDIPLYDNEMLLGYDQLKITEKLERDQLRKIIVRLRGELEESRKTQKKLRTCLISSTKQLKSARGEFNAEIRRLNERLERLSRNEKPDQGVRCIDQGTVVGNTARRESEELSRLLKNYVDQIHNERRFRESELTEQLTGSHAQCKVLQHEVQSLRCRLNELVGNVNKVADGGVEMESQPCKRFKSAVKSPEDITVEVSWKALHETLQVFQDELKAREQMIEELNERKVSCNCRSSSIQNIHLRVLQQQNELMWLNELFMMRIEELEEIIEALNEPVLDRSFLRGAVVRLHASLLMQRQNYAERLSKCSSSSSIDFGTIDEHRPITLESLTSRVNLKDFITDAGLVVKPTMQALKNATLAGTGNLTFKASRLWDFARSSILPMDSSLSFVPSRTTACSQQQ